MNTSKNAEVNAGKNHQGQGIWIRSPFSERKGPHSGEGWLQGQAGEPAWPGSSPWQKGEVEGLPDQEFYQGGQGKRSQQRGDDHHHQDQQGGGIQQARNKGATTPWKSRTTAARAGRTPARRPGQKKSATGRTSSFRRQRTNRIDTAFLISWKALTNSIFRKLKNSTTMSR